MKLNKRKTIVAAVAFLALAFSLALGQGGTGAGQTAPTSKGVVIKGKAPVNKEVLKVKLPRAEESTLPNGLRVVLLKEPKIPTFNIQMVVLSGGLADTADYHGLANFTAALLREGTAKRSSKEISEQIDSLGATLTAV